MIYYDIDTKSIFHGEELPEFMIEISTEAYTALRSGKYAIDNKKATTTNVITTNELVKIEQESEILKDKVSSSEIMLAEFIIDIETRLSELEGKVNV